jgi:hypothetical protein
MTRDWTNGAKKPTPEQLAAYADGELDAVARRECADWLGDHPDAAVEVEAWRRLARVWESAVPPEPAPAAWDAALGRIEKSLPGNPRGPVRAGRRFILWSSLLATAAAAALTVSLSARLFRPSPVGPGDPGELEPYPVATADEVTVISMDVRDTEALVVALPPIHGPLDFAAFEDIELVQADRLHQDAEAPHLDLQLAVPMIVPQPAPWEGRAP